MTKSFAISYTVAVDSSDTARRAFLHACIKAKRCLKCRARLRLVNGGSSIDINHRNDCPELQRIITAQAPDTFKGVPRD